MPRSAEPPDPYRTLGVPRGAPPEQVTATYRALVLALHPDTRREPADPTRLAEVLAAYALLRDPQRRNAYDREHPEPREHSEPPPPGRVAVPVRVHHGRQAARQPDIRVGPVRHHPH
ncbi:DnaJ-class molecular chaperone [Saccharothrix tamanrassetensis]|uniref:DnaJ-class molecular chaperone n=1 Tax=Saccharothrix tamanrassetensis TaxID=1051531 RepID=A0A841CDT4_9PSEU|nr:J domain-containing protein [Saccharothrix tamanrassetensis]MBB5953916.1 DnaJ-class molecular chaperone [Saccharothrix tamanrassetensis]